MSPPNESNAGTSASLTGDGRSNCGASGSESCGASLLVTGGTFNRGRDPNLPATLSDFRLDKYEVTVGRFRKFVEAWVTGWRPSAGAGKHVHLNGGSGLASVTGGYESGWNTAWNTYPGARSAAGSTPSGASPSTVAGWSTSMQCDSGLGTFSASADLNERLPINCTTYYDVQAFCIWDGGFLPTETEWEYAATGGTDYRRFPWGSADPPANASLAIFGCYWNGSGACSGTSSIAPVGSSPAGAARFGQADLAGNTWEWTADWYEGLPPTCTDCVRASPGGFNGRTIRGGAFNTSATALASAFRYGMYHTLADRTGSGPIGFRCARTP